MHVCFPYVCIYLFFLHASEHSQQVWQFWVQAVISLIFLSGWKSVLWRVGWVSQPCYHFCVCPDSELLLSEGESLHKPPSFTLLNVSQPSFNWPTRAWQQPLSLTPLKPPQNTLLFSPLPRSFSLFLSSLHQTTQSGGKCVTSHSSRVSLLGSS